MHLTSVLTKSGLNEKQAKVYLACLELGGAKVSDVSHKAKVQRTTCYHILNELMQLGLISKSRRQKTDFFTAEDPRIIEQKTREKWQALQDVMPELQAIHNILPQRPKISFFDGWEGARNIYEDSIKCSQPGDTILSYSNFEEFNRYLQKPWSVDYYTILRKEKKLRIKIIAVDGPVARRLQKEDALNLRETRIVSVGKKDFTCDIKIYANKVAIISYKENFMSVLIESNEIAEMMKMAFDLMWKGAS